MREQLVSLETAKLAKKKGFNIITHWYYHPNYGLDYNDLEKLDLDDDYYNMNSSHWADEYYSAPTQSSLQKWLRDEYGVHISIIYNKETGEYSLYVDGSVIYIHFKTYKEALEAGLPEALKLIP